MAVFLSVKELLSGAESAGLELWEYVLRVSADETGISTEHSWAQMAARLDAMKNADASYDAGMRSHSGLIGGDGAKMEAYAAGDGGICGEFIDSILAAALRMGECNACMHCIVAAPTAGSAGVLPGILVAADEIYDFGEERLTQALFNAGAVGYLIDRNATLSGAEGGCQAEVGAASAMAASALCELFDGAPSVCLAAAGDAISNILGLVCDPIGGLVESPCQKRNAMGVANAVISAETALATNGKTLVPFDEVVAAMYSVGRNIPYQLRETALGGLAMAPSVRNLHPGCAACGGCK